MKVWKEVISPGEVWYTDEQTGKPRMLDVTSDMVRHWKDSGLAMLKAGLSIPVPLEHQKNLIAMTAAERAAAQLRNNTGWVEGFDIRHGDRLFAHVNIEDEEIARKLPSTIKFTSPYFSSFTDGNGNKWDSVVAHLALTSRPRLTKQEPFQSVAAALSLATPLKPEGQPHGIFLSRAGRLDRIAGPAPLVPHYPMAFSTLSGIELAEGYDGPPKKQEKKPPSKEGGSEKPPPKEGGGKPPSEEGDKPSMEGEGSGDPMMAGGMEEKEMEMVDVLCDMANALWGIELPEGTDEKNLMQRLLKAMLEQLKMENGGGMSKDLEEPELAEEPEEPLAPERKPPPKAPLIQEQPPVYMSLEQVNALPDGDLKTMARAALSMQGQMESLKKNVFEAARKRREQRIDTLARKTGRPGYKERLLAQCKDIQLSLDESGAVKDPFAETLDLLEEGIKDLPTLLKTPAAIEESEHPSDAEGLSEKRRKELVAEIVANAGIPA